MTRPGGRDQCFYGMELMVASHIPASLHFNSFYTFHWSQAAVLLLTKSNSIKKGFLPKKTSSRINDKIINSDIPDDDIAAQELNGNSSGDLK